MNDFKQIIVHMTYTYSQVFEKYWWRSKKILKASGILYSLFNEIYATHFGRIYMAYLLDFIQEYP